MSMETDRIENDLRDSRHRLSDTLDALGSKLSPGQVLDEVMGLAQGQAGHFTANLGRQVRDNPLPAVLIAAGVALLFAQRNHHSGANRSGQRHHLLDDARRSTIRMNDETDEAYDDRLHSAYAKVLEIKQASGEAMSDFKRRVGEMVSHAKQSAFDAGDHVSHAMSGAAHLAAGKARNIGGSVSDARHKAGDFYQDQPLAAGAIALAIGALVGGATPLSNVERDKLGDVADKAMRATGDLAAKGGRMVQESVTPPVH